VVPIGAALVLFGFTLTPRDPETGNPLTPFNLPLLAIGLLVTFVAVTGWLYDAMREWRATAHGEHGTLALAGVDGAALPAGGHALVVAPRGTAVVAQREFVPVEPPPGVHMPGPSPWPFFVPIAATLMLLGVIFSSVLIIGGLILGLIAAGGWLRDASHEWRSTEAVGHAVPQTRDPVKVWPGRLVPLFAAVAAISVLVTLAPIGLGFLNSLTPSAGPSAVPVPAVPEIAASSAVSFETGQLVVPAGRPFDLVFNNKQAGVPHNVWIADSEAKQTLLFQGERLTGPAEITYHVPAITEGDFFFYCEVHPNMKGSVLARPETGGPAPGPGASGSGGPGPGSSAAPQASNPAE
jgi:plastocyanin